MTNQNRMLFVNPAPMFAKSESGRSASSFSELGLQPQSQLGLNLPGVQSLLVFPLTGYAGANEPLPNL